MGQAEERPVVVVIGGPNGAGKTTCVKSLLPAGMDIQQFVNADAIAIGLAGFAPETVAVQAGRLMLARLDQLSQQRQDFAFESTLASRTFAPFLRRLRADGYVVHLYYVWLRSPDLSIQRVAERVARGGHHVPDDLVRRRYARGLRNFMHLYRPVADAWVLCDNSGSALRIVARGEAGGFREIVDQELWDEIERIVQRAEDVEE